MTRRGSGTLYPALPNLPPPLRNSHCEIPEMFGCTDNSLSPIHGVVVTASCAITHSSTRPPPSLNIDRDGISQCCRARMKPVKDLSPLAQGEPLIALFISRRSPRTPSEWTMWAWAKSYEQLRSWKLRNLRLKAAVGVHTTQGTFDKNGSLI